MASHDWPYHGSDAASTRFSPLRQIDGTNLSQLREVWHWRSSDALLSQRDDVRLHSIFNRATPLVVDGVLYTSTSMSTITALDAATGRQLWNFDPLAWKEPNHFNTHRGVAYWEDGDGAERIFFGTATAFLYALDAKTGLPDPTFGTGGRVDLTEGLDVPVDRLLYSLNSPPTVCRGVIVIGSSVGDSRTPEDIPPGDVRGFDARTGEQLWTFHSVPRMGEYGTDTWESDSWRRGRRANAWAVISADPELGYVYVPFGGANNVYYGGSRPGDNLFAQSLVCLDARTGQRVWHYQLSHHDVWDYDLPAAPILVDLVVDGRPIKAVAQITKQAFCFVFDRVTGDPLWPVVERAVPSSTIAGERASPTQPFPTRPLPFDRQGLTVADLINFTPALRQQALEIVSGYDHGGLYTPPTERGAIAMPGGIGGGDWAGAAYHPESGWLYVPSHTRPDVIEVGKTRDRAGNSTYSAQRNESLHGPNGLPLMQPPYSRITAIDLNTGKHMWMAPTGTGPVNHPALATLGPLSSLGSGGRFFVLATPHLAAGCSGTSAMDRGRRAGLRHRCQTLSVGLRFRGWSRHRPRTLTRQRDWKPDDLFCGWAAVYRDPDQLARWPGRNHGFRAAVVGLAAAAAGLPLRRPASPFLHFEHFYIIAEQVLLVEPGDSIARRALAGHFDETLPLQPSDLY
jgi:quinoprotein glucose dehydrogenase